MRKILILLFGAVMCCVVAPGAPRASAARAAAESWPPLSTNNQWVMIETEPMLDHPGGSDEVLEICRRSKAIGYNGLVLWDSHLWERELPEGYLENAERLKAGLHQLGFTLMVQMCPRGLANARWSGDPTMVEPRPARPHPDEKDYRYLCLAHPGIHQVWEEQIVRAEEIYHPIGWLLNYDEIRVAGTDERCRQSGKTPGQLLGEHARKAIAMCRRVTPGRVVALWSDMFDPNFNANSNYERKFHVVGSFAGSTVAIDRDVLLLQWNDKPVSFGFWSRRGNRMIVPLFFDHEITPGQESSLMRVARRTPGVIGWMYYTTQRQYTEVEAYGRQYGQRTTRASRGLAAPSLLSLTGFTF
jgi:hypothetical protein